MQFRAARKAAEALGAQIVLGDRPIEITVNLVLRLGRRTMCLSFLSNYIIFLSFVGIRDFVIPLMSSFVFYFAVPLSRVFSNIC